MKILKSKWENYFLIENYCSKNSIIINKSSEKAANNTHTHKIKIKMPS